MLITLLLIAIIGTWVGHFADSPRIRALCDEWIEFFLGPLRRFPLRIGTFDLMPMVAMIVVLNLIARVFPWLEKLYLSLP